MFNQMDEQLQPAGRSNVHSNSLCELLLREMFKKSVMILWTPRTELNEDNYPLMLYHVQPDGGVCQPP